MRILVSGGAGFIGSHVCERLIHAGHEVLCVDNFISGNFKNVEAFTLNERFRLIRHDITLPFTEDIGEIDQIYHLASPASPVDYTEIPLQTLWTNAAGTKTLLDIAGKQGSSFLLASTSEIYGDPTVHPQVESYFGNVNPVGERSCYAEGKRFAESLAMIYYKDFRFPLKIVRIFNTYGPRMRKHDGRVIPNFIQAALREEPLMVFGNGAQTRSFCYIDDLVDGLLAAMDTKGLLGPMNLGCDDEISIHHLARKIIDLTGSTSLIANGAAASDDPHVRKPDLTLAKEKLGYKPKISLEEGLKKTLEYFQKS